MRIKTKTNSPTVIVIEQGTMDKDKNDLSIKRMDNLERKLDNQYKAITDKKDFVRLLDKMQSSFTRSLDRVVSANKSALTNSHNKQISSLRSEFKTKINSIKSNNNDGAMVKSFANKIGSLENIIKNIPIVSPKVSVINRGPSLDKSFDNFFLKMQELIRKSGPRMIPSPS